MESDDWGSVRMNSREAYNQLIQEGLDLGPGDSLRFNRFDCLESAADLEGLFGVLSKHRDAHGRSAVMTPLCLVANPDFERIEESGFEGYAYERFPVTLERYYPQERVWEVWKEGVAGGLFAPQFHGREHLNVHHWLAALRANDIQARAAFRRRIWGYNNTGVSFQAAFDFTSADELVVHRQILQDGLRLFKEIFGYPASFFVPPNGLLSEQLFADTKDLGIQYVYSSRKNPVPVGEGRREVRYNFLGKRNQAGQRFITRNAFFEPSQEGKNWVDSCLADVERAFRWRKPAIISTHRVNFIGALVESNRKRGLALLDELLARMITRWPDIEFMTTPELGMLMDNE